jgi:hypothetical protein
MWSAIANTMLGVWLMAAPSVLGYGGAARTNDHVVGPIVATLAVIAIAEANRGVRLVNMAPAAWLILAPLLFQYPLRTGVHSVLAGLAVGALSLMGGRIRHQFGGGWASLFRRPGRPTVKITPARESYRALRKDMSR